MPFAFHFANGVFALFVQTIPASRAFAFANVLIFVATRNAKRQCRDDCENYANHSENKHVFSCFFHFLLLIPPFSAVFTQKVYKKERALVNTFFLNGVLPYLNGSILFFALVFSHRRDEQNGEREHAFLRRDIDFAVVLFHDVFY